MAGNDPHGPNPISNYFDVHASRMRDFSLSGFVLEDGVAATSAGNSYITMEGIIVCLGDLHIDVNKILKVLPQDRREPMVQTVEYHYNCFRRGHGNIMRYDSPHDHRPIHHVHRYDIFLSDAEEIIEECQWPHLGDVIGELEEWYWDNRDRLSGY